MIASLAESIPGLHKRLQIRAQVSDLGIKTTPLLGPGNKGPAELFVSFRNVSAALPFEIMFTTPFILSKIIKYVRSWGCRYRII